MKITYLLATLLLAFAGSASAQQTQWIGNTNNSLTATGTAAGSFQTGGWKDVTVNENIPTADNTNPNQFNAANVFGNHDEQGMTIYGFGGIAGITAADVTSASLYANVFDVVDFQNGGLVTFTLYGIDPSLGGFAENATTWANINTSSLVSTYGSFSISSADVINGTWVNYDVTNAFKDYLNGSIGGFAFTMATDGQTFNGNDYAVQFNSQESANASLRPGLLVTVPEPSAALLIGCLGLARLIRRSRRVTNPFA